jgi:hypothetical protein
MPRTTVYIPHDSVREDLNGLLRASRRPRIGQTSDDISIPAPYGRLVAFSIKLAPGVRIRASSRGLRANVGPRAARVHVGAGRTAVSSAIGPVRFYTTLGKGSRRSTAAAVSGYQSRLTAQQALAARGLGMQEFMDVANEFHRLLKAHGQDFPPATPPVAPAQPLPDRTAIYKHYERQALANVGLFQREERAAAKQRAAAWAEAELRRQQEDGTRRQAELQARLNERWGQLCANVPEVVLETLEEAFEDNESPSAAVGVAGDEVSLAILAPTLDEIVPHDWPSQTRSGEFCIRRLLVQERHYFYALFIYSQTLVTVRETMAVAPGVRSARVVVIRRDRIDAYGQPRISCIFAAKFDRPALAGVLWHSVDAHGVVNDIAAECVRNIDRRNGELKPLDLSREQGLRAFIKVADLG